MNLDSTDPNFKKDEVEDLDCFTQMSARIATLEAERDELRQKVDDAIDITRDVQIALGDGDFQDATASLTLLGKRLRAAREGES